MDNTLKYRWLSLYVENKYGVLAKVSGLLAGKSYNVETLTVGTTEDPTVSRMTIGLCCHDATFEQIKKQLNRSVDIIRVLDFTDAPTFKKELLFLKMSGCTKTELEEIAKTAAKIKARIVDKGSDSILLQVVAAADENDRLIARMQKYGNCEVVRGGVVAIEKCSATPQQKV